MSKQNEERKQFFVLIVSFGLLGITTGQLTGQSREPAVAAVLPAVLGLVGAIAIYIMGSKEKAQQMLTACLISIFSLNLLVGTFWGAKLRHDEDIFSKSEEYLSHRAMVEQNIALQKLRYEIQLNKFRNFSTSIEETKPENSQRSLSE